MVAVCSEPAFDAGDDLSDALAADAEGRGDLLLRFAREDVPSIDFAITPFRRSGELSARSESDMVRVIAQGFGGQIFGR
jgi:hypothetical protein